MTQEVNEVKINGMAERSWASGECIVGFDDNGDKSGSNQERLQV